MSTDIVMPQMGESVVEGTIVRWMKRVGDAVDKDEPLFEISTDKVDAEIPSPDAGVLLEIRVQEGDTVPVHTVVGVIGIAGAATGASPAAAIAAATVEAERAPESVRPQAAPPRKTVRDLPRTVPAAATQKPLSSGSRFISPVVRNIARAHGVDPGQIAGSGAAGRVTRRDIEAFIEQGPSESDATPPPYTGGDDVRVEKMSVMRRKIADHMLTSLKTSAHIYSAYEVDFSRLEGLRRKHKARYEQAGANLTYTALIAKAAADAIRECPYVNASLDGDRIIYKRDINIGIAVALEQGLIVPVIRNADKLGMMDLCRAVQDLAARARSKQLKVDEVDGGTFTITNPGIFGGLWGLPIISQPQVAILAIGSIDQRAVVVDGEIVARPMCYFTLGYDHRLIDGADGGRFLQKLKDRVVNFDEALL